MVGTPTIWSSGTGHLGRRKPEVDAVFADARAREDEWQRAVKAVRVSLAHPPSRELVLPASSDPRPVRVLAFVAPHLARRARALASASVASPQTQARRGRARICASIHPDAIRAALADSGDPAGCVVCLSQGDLERERLLRSLGFARMVWLPADDVASIFSPAAFALAALQGAHTAALEEQAKAALEGSHPGALAQEGGPFHLGALLSGLAKRGANQVVLSGPPALGPLFAWLDSAAAQLREEAGFTLAVAEQLREPEAYPRDRWHINYRGPNDSGEGAGTTARARRLIGAGVPLVQLEAPAPGQLVAELVRWQLALGFAGGARATVLDDSDGPLPADHEAALRDGPLAIYAGTPAHAYVLRKVAGTLGKKAEASVPAWLAAQVALGDSGEHVSLHWLGLPTREARETLADLQRTLSGPNKLAVRTTFALPELDGAHPLAGASSRGLFFLLSDGGGAELAGSRRSLLGAEERTLALLANAGRRALLLRAEDGDAGKLVSALRGAGALLTP